MKEEQDFIDDKGRMRLFHESQSYSKAAFYLKDVTPPKEEKSAFKSEKSAFENTNDNIVGDTLDLSALAGVTE